VSGNKSLDFTGQVCYSYQVGGEVGSLLTNNEACERAKEKEEVSRIMLDVLESCK